ncbi:UNVERIFIED_CONTAM: hypothetical protein Slati_3750200 [Sesamum latifolium]|uniref:Gag/pol protein n=1 Tax=Sesamum latifolium TaxID=2727402 RepID=A0AAW2U3Q4_9LAMI
MTNEIQKQYDRLEDVPSIMLHMKDVYMVPDRHIRYAATKAFFRTTIAEGSSVHSHGVKMLFLVEKLEDLKTGLNNDTYIDATTHKSEPTVLVGEASTSKAKGKGARRWKRKKGKGTAVTATASTRGAPPTARRERGKGKGKVGGSHRSKANDVCMHCQGKGHWKRECPQLLSNPGKDDQEALCWTKCNCQRSIGLGSYRYLWTIKYSARGRFSYFITFTDDHSRYGYVYLMKYKSEAFGRFKEYRLEVENQTNRKIKALWSDGGGEYLSGEFIDYLKENGILSQWTPPGMPQLNGVAERRNQTLLDMVRSMMSITELPPSFWGYALETAAKLLNITPSKSVPQTPYEI